MGKFRLVRTMVRNVNANGPTCHFACVEIIDSFGSYQNQSSSKELSGAMAILTLTKKRIFIGLSCNWTASWANILDLHIDEERKFVEFSMNITNSSHKRVFKCHEAVLGGELDDTK